MDFSAKSTFLARPIPMSADRPDLRLVYVEHWNMPFGCADGLVQKKSQAGRTAVDCSPMPRNVKKSTFLTPTHR